MRSKTKRRSSKGLRSTRRNFKRRSDQDQMNPVNLRNLKQRQRKKKNQPRKKMMKLQLLHP